DASVLMVDPDSGQAGSWPPPYLFSDDFSDNNVTDWTATKGSWTAASGTMTGTSVKKAYNFPNAFVSGCSNCTIEADIQIQTAGARAFLLGWYQDKQHSVQLILMDDRNKVMLKRQSGTSIMKKLAAIAIAPVV